MLYQDSPLCEYLSGVSYGNDKNKRHCMLALFNSSFSAKFLTIGRVIISNQPIYMKAFERKCTRYGRGPGTPERESRGEQTHLLPFIWGRRRRDKSVFFEMKYNPLQTLIGRNVDQISYISKQYMFGRELFV